MTNDEETVSCPSGAVTVTTEMKVVNDGSDDVGGGVVVSPPLLGVDVEVVWPLSVFCPRVLVVVLGCEVVLVSCCVVVVLVVTWLAVLEHGEKSV